MRASNASARRHGAAPAGRMNRFHSLRRATLQILVTRRCQRLVSAASCILVARPDPVSMKSAPVPSRILVPKENQPSSSPWLASSRCHNRSHFASSEEIAPGGGLPVAAPRLASPMPRASPTMYRPALSSIAVAACLRRRTADGNVSPSRAARWPLSSSAAWHFFTQRPTRLARSPPCSPGPKLGSQRPVLSIRSDSLPSHKKTSERRPRPHSFDAGAAWACLPRGDADGYFAHGMSVIQYSPRSSLACLVRFHQRRCVSPHRDPSMLDAIARPESPRVAAARESSRRQLPR